MILDLYSLNHFVTCLGCPTLNALSKERFVSRLNMVLVHLKSSEPPYGYLWTSILLTCVFFQIVDFLMKWSLVDQELVLCGIVTMEPKQP